MPMEKRPAEIMLVEDNAADVRLTEEVFKEGGLSFHLQVARDGEQALAMLRREGDYADLLMPDFVLLDLNLPRKDGRQVLAEMKQDPVLKRIPVILLSTSNAPRDVLQCYELQANAYVCKPVDLDEFIDLVEAIRLFWMRFAEIPPKA